MTMEPSPEYVRRQLQLADETLDDARYLLQGNRLKAASNRAYYSMFHAVMVVLAGVSPRLPKTHRGAISLFGQHYIATGKLDVQFAWDLQNANHLCQQSDYGVHSELVDAQAKEAVEKAEAFVSAVKEILQ
jgi:uncharacterized protein (UPF0332 family)